jgi:hypothetical protein
VLSEILPVLLEQAEYEQVYSDTVVAACSGCGTGVKGIFWDPGFSERRVTHLRHEHGSADCMYWEPGVMDIQDSPQLFSLAVVDGEQLTAQYPLVESHTGRSLDGGKVRP